MSRFQPAKCQLSDVSLDIDRLMAVHGCRLNPKDETEPVDGLQGFREFTVISFE